MAGGRKSAVADSFYPGNREELQKEIDSYFAGTREVIKHKKIKALLVPHAGTVYSGQTAAWGYRQLPQIPKPHFILIGPSHHYSIEGLAASGAASWETPLGTVPHVLPKNLIPHIAVSDKVHEPEHDLEVQLPFLQRRFAGFSFTAFATGATVDFHAVSEYLTKQYADSTFIISSDLSHYLPDADARVKDKKTIDAILNGDREYILTEDNVACGHTAIAIAMTMAKKNNWIAELVRHDTSATAFGDTSRVVGYSSIVWYE